jgi:hypothetical protein
MLMAGFCSCVRCRNRLSVVCDCIDRFRYFVIVLIKYETWQRPISTQSCWSYTLQYPLINGFWQDSWFLGIDRDWIECKDRQLWVEIGQRPVQNVLCRQHYLVAGRTKKRRCPQKYTFIMVHMYRKGFKWISWYKMHALLHK